MSMSESQQTTSSLSPLSSLALRLSPPQRPLPRIALPFKFIFSFAIFLVMGFAKASFIVLPRQTAITSSSRRKWSLLPFSRLQQSRKKESKSRHCRSLTSSIQANNDITDTHTSSLPGLQLPSPTPRPIRHVMAPMVAASDFAFRALLRHYQSVDLTFTQMLHARQLTTSKVFQRQHLDFYEYATSTSLSSSTDPQSWLPTQRECVYGSSTAISRELPAPQIRIPQSSSLPPAPLIAQLAGHDVSTMIRAAHVLLDETQGQLHGIDVNLGCPQAIARKGRYGAFLMEQEPDLVYSMLRALRQSLPPTCSVSAKIRLPLEEGKLPECARNPVMLQDRMQRLLETGVNFITLHGRTLRENKTAVGACHVDAIRRAVQTVQQGTTTSTNNNGLSSSSPLCCYVIANGGMETFQDVQDLLRRTGASAAMSSEGLLEVPNLFVNPRYPQDMTPRQIFLQQVQFCRDYLDVAQQYPPLPGVLGAYGSWTIARGHLIKFLHRYLQHDEELARDLRDALLLTSSSSSSTKTASQGRYNCYCVADAYRLIDELQRRYDQLTWEEWEQLPSSRHYTSWYRRHWPDSQVYHNRPINEHDDSSRTGPKLIVMTTKAMMVEERKRQIQARIDQLQKERFARDAVEVQQEDYKAVA